MREFLNQTEDAPYLLSGVNMPTLAFRHAPDSPEPSDLLSRTTFTRVGIVCRDMLAIKSSVSLMGSIVQEYLGAFVLCQTSAQARLDIGRSSTFHNRVRNKKNASKIKLVFLAMVRVGMHTSESGSY